LTGEGRVKGGPAVALDELQEFVRRARAPRLRSLREFAEAEIVIPAGDYAGERFRCYRQAYSGLYFDAIDSGQWTVHVAVGPTQSGKTLTGFIVPTLYHLFELRETVICGLPDMQMAAEKWALDLRPAIEATRYAEFLPQSGDGSRRGKRVETIQFRNGAVLKFMGGGGGETQRAHFTARVLVVTELQYWGGIVEGSEETSKLRQLFGRLRSYPGERRRVYLEGIITTELCESWQRWEGGTASRIALVCPHCRRWVTPEREHLIGWQEAQSVFEARAKAGLTCPSCHALWTEVERRAANAGGVLLHRGQTIEGGTELPQIRGAAPETLTLGFRWNAANNLLLSMADVAQDEWEALRDPDEEAALRHVHQQVWALPTKPLAIDTTPLNFDVLTHRAGTTPRGLVPVGTQALTMHIDLGKFCGHYSVLACDLQARGRVVDYGTFDVPSDDHPPPRAILIALRTLRETILTGWTCEGGGPALVPHAVGIDAAYQGDRESTVVYQFVRETNALVERRMFWPILGHGSASTRGMPYRQPAKASGDVKLIGERYYAKWMTDHACFILHVDADHWKTQVHERLAVPVESSGSMTLFTAPASEHTTYVKHLTAERQVEEYVPGKGPISRWVRERKANHYLDTLYNALMLAHLCGIRMTEPETVAGGPAAATAEAAAERGSGPSRIIQRGPVRRHYR
jgi:phage terminase large subunit GpA-like protein